MTRATLLFIVIAAIAALIVTVAVIARAPVPVNAGTAPSVVNDTTGAEARPVTSPPPGAEPREGPGPSATGARVERGSGVEGVTSAGSTEAPPGGR